MELIIEAKRLTLLTYKDTPNEKTHTAQRTARRCANDFWLQLCESIIQTSSDLQKYQRQVRRYRESSRPDREENCSTEVQHRWDHSQRQRTDGQMGGELLRALFQRDFGHRVGPQFHWRPARDGQTGCSAHHWGAEQSHRHTLERKSPRQWRHTTRGDKMRKTCTPGTPPRTALYLLGRGCCPPRHARHNHRHPVHEQGWPQWLQQLQTLAARIYPESQCGFRAGRSTIDMIITVRRIQEKCREQGKEEGRRRINVGGQVKGKGFTKAFDLVRRKGLVQLLEKIGCPPPPPKLSSLVVSFHKDMKGTVMYDGSCSDPFPISPIPPGGVGGGKCPGRFQLSRIFLIFK